MSTSETSPEKPNEPSTTTWQFTANEWRMLFGFVLGVQATLPEGYGTIDSLPATLEMGISEELLPSLVWIRLKVLNKAEEDEIFAELTPAEWRKMVSQRIREVSLIMFPEPL